jgi:hypothetical protein
MSLTFIAVIGILAGFLCLAVGFFMGDTQPSNSSEVGREKRTGVTKKKVIVPRRKAA